jgi:drug/metabolite transporter (DMT)-like permease
MRGEILIILAQIAYTGSILFVKKLTQEINPILVTCIIALIGTISVLPFLFYFLRDLRLLTGKKIIWAILAGILWITVGEILYILGVSKISISKASLLALFFPLFTTLLGIIFLGEKITLKFLIAAILMLIGYILLIK